MWAYIYRAELSSELNNTHIFTEVEYSIFLTNINKKFLILVI